MVAAPSWRGTASCGPQADSEDGKPGAGRAGQRPHTAVWELLVYSAGSGRGRGAQRCTQGSVGVGGDWDLSAPTATRSRPGLRAAHRACRRGGGKTAFCHGPLSRALRERRDGHAGEGSPGRGNDTGGGPEVKGWPVTGTARSVQRPGPIAKGLAGSAKPLLLSACDTRAVLCADLVWRRSPCCGANATGSGPQGTARAETRQEAPALSRSTAGDVGSGP